MKKIEDFENKIIVARTEEEIRPYGVENVINVSLREKADWDEYEKNLEEENFNFEQYGTKATLKFYNKGNVTRFPCWGKFLIKKSKYGNFYAELLERIEEDVDKVRAELEAQF
jgi:hypothetical protein